MWVFRDLSPSEVVETLQNCICIELQKMNKQKQNNWTYESLYFLQHVCIGREKGTKQTMASLEKAEKFVKINKVLSFYKFFLYLSTLLMSHAGILHRNQCYYLFSPLLWRNARCPPWLQLFNSIADYAAYQSSQTENAVSFQIGAIFSVPHWDCAAIQLLPTNCVAIYEARQMQVPSRLKYSLAVSWV